MCMGTFSGEVTLSFLLKTFVFCYRFVHLKKSGQIDVAELKLQDRYTSTPSELSPTNW